MRSKRRKESACPERGFEPSAPGGRCSEGRIGRNREYCKQQRSKTTIFQPALWMRVQRADGGVASGLLLFTATPQSIRLAAYCQLPGRGAFWGGTICQDIRVNAQVGTRSPYSLPFVILPVPTRSPFRLLVHRTRSTPNPIDKPPFSGL